MARQQSAKLFYVGSNPILGFIVSRRFTINSDWYHFFLKLVSKHTFKLWV